MKKFVAGLLALLVVAAAQAQSIKAVNRVANAKEVGVCWWACADMIGREYRIGPLVGIKELVIKTGVGRDTGARPEDIAHWVKTLNLRPRSRPVGALDTKFLCKCLDDKLPVIASVQHWKGGGAHALLVTEVTREKVDWGEGNEKDYVVSFIDPNRSKDEYQMPWAWFTANASGQLYAFDPKEQDPKLLVPEPLRPGRLNLSTGKFADVKPEDFAPDTTPLGMRPKPAFVPNPDPTLNGPMPYVSTQKYPVKQPSNQDIKDGVSRPDDLIRTPVTSPHSLDYYSEFREKIRRMRLPAPK